MKRRRVITVVLADVAVIAELGIAMYFAGESQKDFTLVFLVVFFGLFIPTLAVTRCVMKKADSGQP